MAATLDQILQQEQLHFQVITQRIDSLYLNLNSANNSQTQAIYSAINNATNSLGGQLYTQSNRVIQSINGQAITLEQELLNTVRSQFNAQLLKNDEVKIALQKKLDAVLANILADVDKQQSIITQNVMSQIDKIYTVVINVGKEIKDLNLQIEGNIERAVGNVTTHDKENTDRLLGIINDNITKGNKSIDDNILQLADKVNQFSGFVPGDDKNNPYNALAALIADIQSKNPPSNDTTLTAIIRLLSGDSAANAFRDLQIPNVGQALSDQVSQIQTIIDRTTRGEYHSLEQFYTDFKRLGVNTDFVGGVLQFLFIIPSLLNIGSQLSGAFNTRVAQLTNAQYELRQLDENTIVLSFIRNLITYDEAINRLKEIGHKPPDAELILKQAFPKFNVDELLKLAHLGKIDASTLQNRMRELGFNEIDAILQGYLKQPRPGINDLIQFAVKEVYSPETYNKFGQYLEFPKDFAEQSKLLGLDEQFAKQYWAAHWDLPSPTMGYDMLHRGIINQEDLKALLKALDVMPFWRDKLIQLSYNIVARVDTRRLYAYGIWDKNKVYQNYLHEGYSPEDANSLTQFTIQYDDEQDNKHKSKLQTAAHNVYIKSFKYGLIDRQTALNKIVALGYKENDIKLELDLEQYENYVDSHKPKKENHVSKIVSISLDGYRKRAVSRQTLLDTLTQNGYTQGEANTEIDFIDREIDIVFKENIVKEIQKLYFESLYDDNAVLTRLTSLGFSNSEILKIIAELKILKGLDVKKPSQAQFEKMVKKGFISGLEYAKVLAEMGYNEKYIPYLVQLASAVD